MKFLISPPDDSKGPQEGIANADPHPALGQRTGVSEGWEGVDDGGSAVPQPERPTVGKSGPSSWAPSLQNVKEALLGDGEP